MKIIFLGNNLMQSSIKKWVKQHLSDEKYRHVLGVEKTAVELAKRFGVDENKASIAALLHDCAKNLKSKELLEIIREKEIVVSEMEMKCTKTLHSPVGAYFAQVQFGIEDKEILDAIRYHTIGHNNMTTMDKIIFLADKIEPETREKDFVDKVRNILDSTNNIDEALLICYDATIRSLLGRQLVINPDTIEVYNHLVLKLQKS
jgi:predicted HD superfamily hydrolase involved in NAD metabolism